MFIDKKLIFAVLLGGCTTAANDIPRILPTEESIPVVEAKDDCLLESIDATLEVADEAINEIVKDKKTTNRTISYLNKVVNEEKEIISNLEGELANKESLITSQATKLEILTEQLILAQQQLEETIQNHTEQYNKLVEENTVLKENLDTLHVQIEYLDSLILTNKKLTKVYESN
jgi:chromosome segregation ATPase